MFQKSIILKSTINVMIITVIGFILGLAVQVLMANYFGASKEVDAFVVSSIIPEFIYGITNAILFTSLLVLSAEHSLRASKREIIMFKNNVLNISLVCLTLLSILIFLFAPLITKIIAPGFELDRFNLTVQLIRVLSITIIFYGISSFTTGILYSRKQFIAPMLFKSILSISIILSIFFLTGICDIFSLAIGLIIGTCMGLILQIITIAKRSRDYCPFINLHDPWLKKLVLLSAPLICISFFFYFNKYIGRIIASALPEGNVAILTYAFTIVSAPAMLFGGSMATVIFPYLTNYAARKEMIALKKLVIRSMQILILVLVPLTVGLIIFRIPLLKLVFEHGLFKIDNTSTTAVALLCYSLGLLAFGLEPVIAQTFYSLGKMKSRAILLFATFLINILLSLLLIKPFSYAGLAIATSASYLIILPFTIYIMHLYLKIDLNRLFNQFIKILVSSILMGLIMLGIYQLLFIFIPFGKIYEFFVYLIMFLTGLLSYLMLLRILHVRETGLIKTIIKGIYDE